jgi:hypothetical protein
MFKYRNDSITLDLMGGVGSHFRKRRDMTGVSFFMVSSAFTAVLRRGEVTKIWN